MESNKYFVPDITDIRVGYEGQYHNWCMDELGKKELNYDRWDTTILNSANVETMLKYGISSFRVPYLTKEQIIAEGYKFYSKSSDGLEVFILEPIKGILYELVLNTGEHKIIINKIVNVDTVIKKYTLIQCECKDINTFRYICKLLNIN